MKYSFVDFKVFFSLCFGFKSYDMISNIRKSFIDMLEESTWMDDVSKGRAKEKVEFCF